MRNEQKGFSRNGEPFGGGGTIRRARSGKAGLLFGNPHPVERPGDKN